MLHICSIRIWLFKVKGEHVDPQKMRTSPVRQSASLAWKKFQTSSPKRVVNIWWRKLNDWFYHGIEIRNKNHLNSTNPSPLKVEWESKKLKGFVLRLFSWDSLLRRRNWGVIRSPGGFTRCPSRFDDFRSFVVEDAGKQKSFYQQKTPLLWSNHPTFSTRSWITVDFMTLAVGRRRHHGRGGSHCDMSYLKQQLIPISHRISHRIHVLWCIFPHFHGWFFMRSIGTCRYFKWIPDSFSQRNPGMFHHVFTKLPSKP